MSNKVSKEIECLERLDSLISVYDEVLDFLLKESLITREEIKGIKSSSAMAKSIQGFLSSLSKANKLSLLEYEWIVLPVERVKLTVITDRDSREFSYNY